MTWTGFSRGTENSCGDASVIAEFLSCDSVSLSTKTIVFELGLQNKLVAIR